jgi:hypothetical protein
MSIVVVVENTPASFEAFLKGSYAELRTTDIQVNCTGWKSHMFVRLLHRVMTRGNNNFRKIVIHPEVELNLYHCTFMNTWKRTLDGTWEYDNVNPPLLKSKKKKNVIEKEEEGNKRAKIEEEEVVVIKEEVVVEEKVETPKKPKKKSKKRQRKEGESSKKKRKVFKSLAGMNDHERRANLNPMEYEPEFRKVTMVEEPERPKPNFIMRVTPMGDWVKQRLDYVAFSVIDPVTHYFKM